MALAGLLAWFVLPVTGRWPSSRPATAPPVVLVAPGVVPGTGGRVSPVLPVRTRPPVGSEEVVAGPGAWAIPVPVVGTGPSSPIAEHVLLAVAAAHGVLRPIQPVNAGETATAPVVCAGWWAAIHRAVVQGGEHARGTGGERDVFGHVLRRRGHVAVGLWLQQRAGHVHPVHLALQVVQHMVGSVATLHSNAAVPWTPGCHDGLWRRKRHGLHGLHWRHGHLSRIRTWEGKKIQDSRLYLSHAFLCWHIWQ